MGMVGESGMRWDHGMKLSIVVYVVMGFRFRMVRRRIRRRGLGLVSPVEGSVSLRHQLLLLLLALPFHLLFLRRSSLLLSSVEEG